MDTLKDKHNLDALVESGQAPWEVWEFEEDVNAPTPGAPE